MPWSTDLHDELDKELEDIARLRDAVSAAESGASDKLSEILTKQTFIKQTQLQSALAEKEATERKQKGEKRDRELKYDFLLKSHIVQGEMAVRRSRIHSQLFRLSTKAEIFKHVTAVLEIAAFGNGCVVLKDHDLKRLAKSRPTKIPASAPIERPPPFAAGANFMPDGENSEVAVSVAGLLIVGDGDLLAEDVGDGVSLRDEVGDSDFPAENVGDGEMLIEVVGDGDWL
jgi:hypothetical protein